MSINQHYAYMVFEQGLQRLLLYSQRDTFIDDNHIGFKKSEVLSTPYAALSMCINWNSVSRSNSVLHILSMLLAICLISVFTHHKHLINVLFG